MEALRLLARFQRARQDTQGFRAWKREIAVAVITVPLAYMLLLHYGSTQSAMEEVVAILAAVIAAAILVPVGEFMWNWHKAPMRMLQEENEILRSQIATTKNQTNRTQLETALREGEQFARTLDIYQLSYDLKDVLDFQSGIMEPFSEWLRRTTLLLPVQDQNVFIRGEQMQFPVYGDSGYLHAWEKLGAPELQVHVLYCLKMLRDAISRANR